MRGMRGKRVRDIQGDIQGDFLFLFSVMRIYNVASFCTF